MSQHLENICLILNVVLGLTAGFAVGWRAVWGFMRDEIAYKRLFVVFCLEQIVIAVGAVYSRNIGRSGTAYTPVITGVLLAVTLACLFPKPSHKETP